MCLSPQARDWAWLVSKGQNIITVSMSSLCPQNSVMRSLRGLVCLLWAYSSHFMMEQRTLPFTLIRHLAPQASLCRAKTFPIPCLFLWHHRGPCRGRGGCNFPERFQGLIKGFP